MNSGQLAQSNADIIALVYYTESERNILYTPLIISNTQVNANQRGWPMILGILLGVVLLFVLLLAAIWKRKAREYEVKFNEINDGERSFSSFDHLHLQHYVDVSGKDSLSNLSSPIDDIQESSSSRELQDHVMLFDSENFAHEDSDALENFVENRRMRQNSWNSDDDTQNNDEAMVQADYLMYERPKQVIDFRSPSESALNSYIGETSTIVSTSPNGGGRVRDEFMICSICNKSTEGMPRKLCACGKETCNLSAHTLCVLEKYPLPSVAHPGTPPTMLPVVLCRYRPKT
jgi:hypothetical protein